MTATRPGLALLREAGEARNAQFMADFTRLVVDPLTATIISMEIVRLERRARRYTLRVLMFGRGWYEDGDDEAPHFLK